MLVCFMFWGCICRFSIVEGRAESKVLGEALSKIGGVAGCSGEIRSRK